MAVFFADLLFLLLVLMFVIFLIQVLVCFEGCVHCGRLAVCIVFLKERHGNRALM